MKYPTSITPQDYIEQLPEEHKMPMQQLRVIIKKNLPKGFEETINYGMIGYVVPHKLYPNGYHCNSKLPLPFINIASQKNFIAFYHCGIYANSKLLNWFVAEYPKHSRQKLDMGKSCVRFKKIDAIPYSLIGTLVAKLTPDKWIAIYRAAIKKK